MNMQPGIEQQPQQQPQGSGLVNVIRALIDQRKRKPEEAKMLMTGGNAIENTRPVLPSAMIGKGTTLMK